MATAASPDRPQGATAASKGYHLCVIGGNKLIHNGLLHCSFPDGHGNADLGVSQAPNRLHSPVQISIDSIAETGQIRILPTNPKKLGSCDNYMILAGAVGMGVPTLRRGTPDGDGGWKGYCPVGISLQWRDWRILDWFGRRLLRAVDDGCSTWRGHWVAKREEGGWWAIHWYEPMVQNMGLLSDSVAIDLEIVDPEEVAG